MRVFSFFIVNLECEVCPLALHATFKALRCWGFIERQTNQQQKAKLVKQMYTTLTVRPNIVKPLLAVGGELKTDFDLKQLITIGKKGGCSWN